MKELIHFAHGNGFPALCYTQMLNQLAPRFDYCFIDRIGHNPLYPVSENWANLVREIIDSVESQANQPVIAVGHSLGGILSLLAAIEKPELFKAVIMLDSPIIGHYKSILVRWAKVLGLIDRFSPANATKGRRPHWKDHDLLLHYLASKNLFKTFTPACLNDYIEYGLCLKEDGYHLRFDRHIEYQIYRTLPHNLPSLKGKLKTPSALIYGDKSTVVNKMDLRYMQRHFDVQNIEIHGTHLFPMEHPKAAAQSITQAVDKLLSHQGE